MYRAVTRRGWAVLLGIPALFVFSYLVAFSPTLINLPLCAVKMFTGVDCPGCGLTRSLVFLSHGRLKESIDFHPLGSIILILLLFVFVKTILNAVLKGQTKPLLSQGSKDILTIAFIIALFTHWIAKLMITL